MICRFVVVTNVLSKSTLLSVATIDTIQFYRPLFIIQVQLSFLNLLWERMLAVRFPERYEKAPISIGISILVVWWIFIAFLLYVVSPVVSSIAGFIIHLCALGLTRHWIKMQKAYPTSTANLSTRYQISENIKTLFMFRYWVYFYVAMSVVEKTFLVFAYISFKKTQKSSWRAFCNMYDLSHAFYVFAFPAFLLYGSPSLRRHLANLCRRRSRMIRASEHQVRIENSRVVNKKDRRKWFLWSSCIRGGNRAGPGRFLRPGPWAEVTRPAQGFFKFAQARPGPVKAQAGPARPCLAR
uniref:XK-related protein n=3 Tax=Bursaphelenchus xylophilus TaxID=6326 RepID=A0A1I7SII5_BURXY